MKQLLTILITFSLFPSSVFSAVPIKIPAVPEIDYATIISQPTVDSNVLRDANSCMPTEALGNRSNSFLFDSQTIADQAYYQARLVKAIPKRCELNNTITHEFQGKGMRVKRVGDQMKFDCYCGPKDDPDQKQCLCRPGDGSIVLGDNLMGFNEDLGVYGKICNIYEPECGCEDLNVFVGIGKDSLGKKRKTLYGKLRDDRVIGLCFCDSTPECNRDCVSANSDVVVNGIRWKYNEKTDEKTGEKTNELVPRCFCSSLGCGCTGYNEARYVPLPNAPVRDIQAGDSVQTFTDDLGGIWRICNCGEPNCILGCYDSPENLLPDEVIQQFENEIYYDEEGQPQRGSGWGKLGTVLGIASAVIPFVSGGLGEGLGGGGGSDAAGHAMDIMGFFP